jgi:hypothetical protein
LLEVKVPDCHCDDNRVIPSKHKIDGDNHIETAYKASREAKMAKASRILVHRTGKALNHE